MDGRRSGSGIYEWEALSTEVGRPFMNTIGNLFILFLFSM